MSKLAGCDRCKETFIADSEGSSSFSGTINRKYDNGEKYQEHASWDFCPDCTELLEAPKAGKPDYAKIARLELDNGIPPTSPPSQTP